MEVSRFVRSTKIIILALFVIFINILIVEPLRVYLQDISCLLLSHMLQSVIQE